MGPSQICGCPFREPRVFEIAHIYIYIIIIHIHFLPSYNIYIYIYMYACIYSAQLGIYNPYDYGPNSSDPIEWDGLTADFLCKAWVGQA